MSDDIDRLLITIRVLNEVGGERDAQDATWGEQNHAEVGQPFSGEDVRDSYAAMADEWKADNEDRVRRDCLTWDGILLEEVFEALSERDPAKRRAELIQVAAVAVAMVEASDRKEADGAA